MTKNERLRLEFLSKELYGTSSKYLKMIRNGEKVPKPESKTFEIKRYTEKEIGPFMEELYKEEMELKAAQEKEANETKDTIKDILETVES